MRGYKCMARKGKNKTGPRHKDGSPVRDSIASEFSGPVSQGNRDNQTSSISARAAIQQLINNGYLIAQERMDKRPTDKQRKVLSFIHSSFNVQFAKVSKSGESVYLFHPAKPDVDVTVPCHGVRMLDFKAVDNLCAKTGIHLVAHPSTMPR